MTVEQNSAYVEEPAENLVSDVRSLTSEFDPTRVVPGINPVNVNCT